MFLCLFQVPVRSDGLIIAPGLGLCWPCCCARGWHVSQGRNRNTTLTKHVEDKTTVEETMNTTYFHFSLPWHLSYTRRHDWTLPFPRQFPLEIFSVTDLWPALESFAFEMIKKKGQMTYWLLTFLVKRDLLYNSHLSVVFV